MSKQHQFCTFFLNEIYFGIAVEQVQEVIRYQPMTRVPLSAPDICGLINLRGQIVTAIDLGRRLSLRDISVESLFDAVEEERPFNVVAYTEDEVVSFLVDDIGDVLEVALERFEPPPATLHARVRQVLRGAYKLEQGFLLILDLEKVLQSPESLVIN